VCAFDSLFITCTQCHFVRSLIHSVLSCVGMISQVVVSYDGIYVTSAEYKQMVAEYGCLTGVQVGWTPEGIRSELVLVGTPLFHRHLADTLLVFGSTLENFALLNSMTSLFITSI